MQPIIMLVPYVDCFFFYYVLNRFDGVIVNLLASSVADSGLKLQSCQTKHYKIDVCCFFGKHATKRSKILVWHDPTRELLFK